jgi:hypothetical protein
VIVRCVAPRDTRWPRGARCKAFVTRFPWGYRLEVVSLLAHSDLAAPASQVYACSRCGMLHEVRAMAVELPLAA